MRRTPLRKTFNVGYFEMWYVSRSDFVSAMLSIMSCALTGRLAVNPGKARTDAISEQLSGLFIYWAKLLTESAPVCVKIDHHHIEIFDNVVKVLFI